jgi:hypothetical protein
MSSPERFEAKQLIASGVLPASELYGEEEEGHEGLGLEEGEDAREGVAGAELLAWAVTRPHACKALFIQRSLTVSEG